MEDDKQGGKSVANKELKFKVADIGHSKASQSNMPTNVHETKSGILHQKYSKFSSWLHKHYRFIILLLIAITAVAVGIVMAIVIANKSSEIEESRKTTGNNDQVVEHKLANDASVDAIREECSVSIANNGVESATACWQHYIDANQNSSAERKATLYSGRANQLITYYPEHKDLATQIISDLKMVDQLQPTWQTAYAVYNFLSYSGDKEQAEQWQKIYQERYNSEHQTQPQTDNSSNEGVG